MISPIESAHPLTGHDGLFYSPEGEEFVTKPAEQKSYFRQVVVAKLNAEGALALGQYLEEKGYLLPASQELAVRIAEKPILAWVLPAAHWRKIKPAELAQVLKPYALTREQCQTTNSIFAVTYWQYRFSRRI